MDKFGIPCNVVIGETIDGDSNVDLHGWNIVEINGNYYQLDATWDDPGTNYDFSTTPKTTHHEYFCVDDEFMSASRTQLSCVRNPKCNKTDYNFYNYFGLVFDEMKDNAFEHALTVYKENEFDRCELKFTSKEALDAAEEYFSGDNSNYWDIVDKYNCDFSYSSKDEEMMIFALF